MGESNFTLRVVVEPGRCWGRLVGEDSGEGACQLCVDMCPEVFEKRLPNQCARVRPAVDPVSYLARVRRAAKTCPVNAIHLVKDSGGTRSLGSPSLWR